MKEKYGGRLEDTHWKVQHTRLPCCQTRRKEKGHNKEKRPTYNLPASRLYVSRNLLKYVILGYTTIILIFFAAPSPFCKIVRFCSKFFRPSDLISECKNKKADGVIHLLLSVRHIGIYLSLSISFCLLRAPIISLILGSPLIMQRMPSQFVVFTRFWNTSFILHIT